MTAGPTTSVASFCRLCPASCGIEVDVVDGAAVAMRGDRSHLLSRGYTCPKGRRLLDLVDDPARLDRPLVRAGTGRLTPVSWDDALDDLASRLDTVRAGDGAEAIGTYAGTMLDSAGRAYADRLLARLGSPQRYTSATVDSIAKVLVPKLMAGREGLVPAVDFERTTLLLIVGENTVVSHGAFSYFPDPVRYIRSVAARGEVWVIDPRRTETSRLATRHLRPRSSTDHALMGHLVREVLRSGADTEYLDRHARHLDELRSATERFDLAATADVTGLDPADLSALAAAVRRHRRLAIVTGTGVTMAATGNVTEWLAFALQIVTGSFERPGGRWFNHSAAVAPGGPRPDTSGFGPGSRSRPDIGRFANQYPCAVMASEIEIGRLRALMVIGGNPIVAFPQPARLAGAFGRLDVLAVWDVVGSATADLATHVFPCPSPLERGDAIAPLHLSAVYAQYAPPVVPPRGERRPMWWSLGALADRLGVPILPTELDRCTDDDVFADLTATWTVPWATLSAAAGRPVGGEPVERWVELTSLPGGRWDLAPAPLLAQLDAALVRRPARLVLGNRREVHHTNSNLTWGVGERPPLVPYVYLGRDDAHDAGVADGVPVEVVSAHGSLVGEVRVDDGLPRGIVNVPHGFAEPNVGHLTSTDTEIDPLSGMPTLVGVPVTVTALDREGAAGDRTEGTR